ncbi:hypothetical protein HPP92_022435 [Vanilla planifolia]|uniref:Uncharacterized protein n=1 Tax=Vanilla planifolia TaxID=51239 RepID=A0A835PU38_VANPL|nr:hypothetical protein HPP92_022435 [Vanilla planifolia]
MSINRGLRRRRLFVLFRLEEERLKERRRSYSFSLEFVCSFTSFFSLILAPSVLRLSGSVSIAKVRACLIIALRNSKLLIKGRDGGEEQRLLSAVHKS